MEAKSLPCRSAGKGLQRVGEYRNANAWLTVVGVGSQAEGAGKGGGQHATHKSKRRLKEVGENKMVASNASDDTRQDAAYFVFSPCKPGGK